MTSRFLQLAAFAAAVLAAIPSPQSLKSELTIVVDNDLQGAKSPTSNSSLLVIGKPRTLEQAQAGCAALGEQLWSPELKTASIQTNLYNIAHQGKANTSSDFWIAPFMGRPRSLSVAGATSFIHPNTTLPVLCTQTAPYSTDTTADTSDKWRVTVRSNNEEITGFRDHLSFRFLGIRYAPQPKRFTYSVPYKGSGGSVNATKFGSQCSQGASAGTEDCHFLNIWTPHLPRPGCSHKKKALKPVMFWIHGGAFTSGTGGDPTMDGGNLASRGDVLLVTINYRLSTLGFLALNDGTTNGNFGIADQINALDWVRAHIQDFGGDPDRITIFGQSAGAGSVRALMASPKAVGKFAGVILLSNLGGINYGTTYSKYYTIPQEVSVAANEILRKTNCTDAPSQLECLRALPPNTLTGLSTVARYVVVDGTFITSDELQLDGPKLPFQVMMGIIRDDGAPFIAYPKTTNVTAYLNQVGFDVPSPTLFPIPTSANETMNIFNMSSRLATDGIYRCVDQATVKRGLRTGRFDSVYYYEFDRTYQLTGWPKSDFCEAPKTADRPYGDPRLPYLKCHGGELYYVFGNLARQNLPMRDEWDLPMEQFTLDSFSSFARRYNPNPDGAFLQARGYIGTAHQIKVVGEWEPATKDQLTMKVMEWPTRQGPFRELPQCESLGLGLNYYG